MKKKIRLIDSTDFDEALRFRNKKYFRYDNSKYWLKYYSKKLEARDVKREKMYARIIAKYCREDTSVLDIGSGFGFLAKELDELDLRVTCADYYEQMILIAKQYLKGTNVEYLHSDILSIPQEKKYNCVVLMSVMEHFPREEVEEDIIPYVKSLIKPNGYLFLHVPVRSAHSLFARFFRKFVENDLPSWAIDDDSDITHKFWASASDYTQMLEKNGFSLVNYDSRFTRSNLKPMALAKIMRNLQEVTKNTDVEFNYKLFDLPARIRLLKWLKSHAALTSYFLFKRDS